MVFIISEKELEKVKNRIHDSISKTGRVYGYELRKIYAPFQIWIPEVFWTDESKFKEDVYRDQEDGEKICLIVPVPDGKDPTIYDVSENDDEDEKTLKEMVETIREDLKEVKTPLIEFDQVSNPSHYTEGRKYEPRKVIYDWGLDFNLGNAIKYISRAGRKKDAIEDLKKAIQYIEFELEELENGKFV